MVRPIDEIAEAKKSAKAFIATFQTGLDKNTFESEYEWTNGEPFKLPTGFNTLEEFFSDIPEIKTKFEYGRLMYFIADDPKLEHLQEMIAKQKPPRKIVKDVQIVEVIEKRQARNREFHAENRRLRRHKSLNDRRNLDTEDSSGRNSRGSSRGSSAYIPPTITSPPRNRRIIQTPVCPRGQLLGDDFLLQLAIRNMSKSIWREFRNGPLHCGLCVSGQTVRECIKSLRSVDVLSNRIVICLGAEDIYRGRESLFIQRDYEELLELLEDRFLFSRKAITICTVPPLGNLSWMTTPGQFTAMRAFNHFLVEMANDNGYGLVDFYGNFSTVQGAPNWELFQVEPRRVSGTPNSYLLFSEQGRRLGMTLLNSGMDYVE